METKKSPFLSVYVANKNLSQKGKIFLVILPRSGLGWHRALTKPVAGGSLSQCSPLSLDIAIQLYLHATAGVSHMQPHLLWVMLRESEGRR